MTFGLEIFNKLMKNVKSTSMAILATIAILSLAVVPLLSGWGYDIGDAVVTASLILVGLVLIVESGVKGIKAPSGIWGIVNLALFIVGIGVLLIGVFSLGGAVLPSWVQNIGGYGALALVVAVFLP